MDIVTHSMIGIASASGLMHTHPLLACGVVVGNVLPDLDAFSRLGGKHAFLRFHQTYSHSLAAITIPIVLAIALSFTEHAMWAGMAFGTGVGMAMHVGLDLTNSYGVRCLWPISKKRYALDWIFFIDAPILGVTLLTLAVAWGARDHAAWLAIVSVVYVACMIGIVIARAVIANRARRFVRQSALPEATVTLIPTTWSPLKFLACCDSETKAVTMTINAASGQQTDRQEIVLLDEHAPSVLLGLREWRVMRELSSHYHVVERASSEDGETFTCRDLRIRNFGTRFGTLTCRIDSDGNAAPKRWEV